MKAEARSIITALFLAAFNTSAATHYVSLDSPNPSPPYTNWDTAAHVIQDAVDAAKDGDTVLVTNGVYATGQRGAPWDSSRVVITNAIRLESANGPLLTTIEGSQVREEETGRLIGGMRCVSLAANAILSGFTLTNGYAIAGGPGVRGGTLYKCTLSGNAANRGPGAAYKGGHGGGAAGSTLYSCTLSGNMAVGDLGLSTGGGAYYCTLYNCTLNSNSAANGGGCDSCTLFNCTVTGNSAGKGGGALGCTLYNCTLSGNSANMPFAVSPMGGGAAHSKLHNCTLAGNSAWEGGGVGASTLYNCLLTGNSAQYTNHDGSERGNGGGAFESTLYNCVLTGNSAVNGGGTWGGALYNCVVYYNSGGNYAESDVWPPLNLNYCCTTPLPTNGVGNITGPPLFMDMDAGDLRLREDSPCIDKGTNLLGFPMKVLLYVEELDDFGWVVLGSIADPTDILGNTRFIDGNGDGKVAWDIGAYEFNSFKPPRFTVAPQLTTNGWLLNVTGEPNKWMRVQKSNNTKDWQDIWSGFMGADGVCQVTDDDVGQKVMFYRAVVR